MKFNIKYILVAVFMLFGFAANAQQTTPGINARKDVTDNGDGTYTLTLESFVTGKKTWGTVSINKPLDIVLVLDTSGSMNNNFSGGHTYIASSRSSWSAARIGWDAIWGGDYYYKYDGDYYKVENEIHFSGCGLKFKAKGKTWYIQKDGSVKSTIEKAGLFDEDFNVQLYILSQAKIDALKAAAMNFVENIAASGSASGVTHKIGVVQFSDPKNNNAAKVVMELSSNLVGENGVIKAVGSLTATGATAADDGMLKAYEMIRDKGRQDAIKAVVMFTDGDPNHGNGFNETVANGAIQNSYSLKNTYSAVVYTIGVFDDPSANTNKYMNYVSSKYPQAQSLTEGGAVNPNGKDYYFTTASAEGLNQIFTAISEDIANMTDDESRDLSSATIYDEITSQYELPRGANGSISSENVRLYVSAVTGIANYTSDNRPDWVFSWGEKVAYSKSNSTQVSEFGTINVTIDGSSELDNVKVNGYKFKENWCGPEIATNGQMTPHGYKLIIEIDIVPNPDADATGASTTNTGNSGIYIGDEITEPIVTYPQPVAPGDIDIFIVREDLQNNESAIYTITSDNPTAFPGTLKVALSTAHPTATIRVKTAVKNSDGTFTPINYTVTETAWSWSYDTTNPSAKVITKPVIIITTDGDETTYSYDQRFDFVGSKKQNISTKYSEKTK